MPRTYQRTPPEQRCFAKVDAFGDCWGWTGGHDQNGYAKFTPHRGRRVSAHKYIWEILVGPVPEGMELDHQCRNRGCVNPDHLEVVTHSENMRRSFHFIARRRHQIHCLRGHLLAGENIYRHRNGTRSCRACHLLLRRANYTPRPRREAQPVCKQGHLRTLSPTNGRYWCPVCQGRNKANARARKAA